MYTLDVAKAATNISIYLEIIDAVDGTPETGVVFNTAGIDLQYRRDGAISTSITEVNLAALTTAHTDGGFLHVGNGIYRFDIPDAAFVTGQDRVLIHGTVTGMIVIPVMIQLVNELDLGSDNRVLVSADVHTSGETVAAVTGATGSVTAAVSLLTATQNSIDAIEVDTAMLASSYVAPDNSSISLILADTADLQANQGSWATATGFATSAALATVDSNVDAVKVATDKLTFTTANQVDANVQYVNDRELTGDGAVTPFDVV